MNFLNINKLLKQEQVLDSEPLETLMSSPSILEVDERFTYNDDIEQ
jgi:hypothetical protein